MYTLFAVYFPYDHVSEAKLPFKYEDLSRVMKDKKLIFTIALVLFNLAVVQ